MKVIKFLLAAYLGFILVSCNSDIDPNNSNFIVIASSPGLWAISNYNSLTDEYVQIAQPKWVYDAALVNSNLFTIGAYDTISKIELNGNTFQETIIKKRYWHNSSFRGLVEEFGDQLLLTATSYLNGNYIHYLNFYDANLNLTDSLKIAETPSEQPVIIFDILAADDKIFLSTRQEGTSLSWITIIDGFSKNILGVFETDVYARELAYHDKVLYGFSVYLLYQIDITSMSLSSRELQSSVSQARSSSVSFTSKDIFYFFQGAAQPSPTPNLLRSYNILNSSTQDHSPLRWEYRAPPMSYDSNNKLLVISGGRNLMSLIRLDGSLERNITIPEDDINFILKR